MEVSEYDKVLLDSIGKLDEKIDSLQESVNDIKIEQAVHEVKIARSSAFFGAMSGLLIAILAPVIINYVSAPVETEQPRVIYKEKAVKSIEDADS